MGKTIISIVVITFLALVPLATQNTAQAQCKTKASCKASDDSGPYVLCYNGPYDPCDNNINWTITFTRTDQDTSAGNTTLKFMILDETEEVFVKYYSAGQYSSPGSYQFNGSQFVGTSSSHRLYIKRQGTVTGFFEEIKFGVEYVGSGGTE